MTAFMDFEQARLNMVEQQIRPWEVLDQHILDTISITPREEFVSKEHQQLAFSDMNIPLPHDQMMMRPNVEGRLLQALNIQKTDKVLEIGTGSGYLTACLAKLAHEVTSVDIFTDITSAARTTLEKLDINNVQLLTGDASHYWGEPQQFDVIAITGSLPDIPITHKKSLTLNGRLFAIVGNSNDPIMEALLLTRTDESQWSQESLFETWIPPLLNIQQSKTFKF